MKKIHQHEWPSATAKLASEAKENYYLKGTIRMHKPRVKQDQLAFWNEQNRAHPTFP